jgi:hypothetical protein
MDIGLVGLIANIGALGVAGILYAAYVKNLRSMVNLKKEQLGVAEQNIKLWKDRASELEKQTPQFIEKILNDRIKVREDEVTRLAKDGESHKAEIELKGNEIELLKKDLEYAQEYRPTLSVYDPKEKDFIDVQVSELTQEVVGEICVDSASLMIGDPWYRLMNSEQENDLLTATEFRFQNITTGEIFCTNDDLDSEPSMENFYSNMSLRELVQKGMLKELPLSDNYPIEPSTYIKGDYQLKGDLKNYKFPLIRNYSFLNGMLGAGVSISLPGDGIYSVKTESYKGVIQRVIIDI